MKYFYDHTFFIETWFYYPYSYTKCEPVSGLPAKEMKAKNLEDAKAECTSKPNKECRRFYDYLGQGNRFFACPTLSSELGPSDHVMYDKSKN